MKHHAKAASAGSTEVGGSARGLLRRAFATRAASPGSKGSGAPSRRRLGAPLGLLILLALLVGLFTASSASAYFIPKLVEVNEVEYNSAHAVALASSDEFLDGWNFEVSTDGGSNLELRPPVASISGPPTKGRSKPTSALKGGTHYAVRFNLGGVVDPKAPGPYPEFTTLPVTPPKTSRSTPPRCSSPPKPYSTAKSNVRRTRTRPSTSNAVTNTSATPSSKKMKPTACRNSKAQRCTPALRTRSANRVSKKPSPPKSAATIRTTPISKADASNPPPPITCG